MLVGFRLSRRLALLLAAEHPAVIVDGERVSSPEALVPALIDELERIAANGRRDGDEELTFAAEAGVSAVRIAWHEASTRDSR